MKQLLVNLLRTVSLNIYYMIGWIKTSMQGVKLDYRAKISPKANVGKAAYIGNASIAKDVFMGKGSYINSGVIHSGLIGAYCSIGYDVCIGPAEHDYKEWTTSPHAIKKTGTIANIDATPPPQIGDDVWIGAGAIILRGSKIGTGTVVAAGALIKGEIPGYEIWGGVPAKFIKKRFNEPQKEIAARSKLNSVISAD